VEKAAGNTPFVLIANDNEVATGPLPANEEEMMNLLRRFGGE
jgi:hypothetical protein